MVILPHGVEIYGKQKFSQDLERWLPCTLRLNIIRQQNGKVISKASLRAEKEEMLQLQSKALKS